MQGVTHPLNPVYKDRDGTGVKNRLECAADVDGEQEHHVHHQQEDRQTEEAVEHNLIHRRRKAAGFCRQRVTDHVADRGDSLVTGIGDVQRRVVQLVAETGHRRVQFICRMSGIGAAIDIAFQHLQAEPLALFCRHAFVHLLRQQIGFAQQRAGVMHQLNVVISRVTVNRQLQGINPASAR